ncbi:MAG: efflux RND transporter periplasmic adaptor subunit [Solidesulfovibrio sp.]
MSRIFFTRAVVLALSFSLWSCGRTDEQKNGREARPAPVVAVAAKAATLPLTVKAVGNVEPMATVAIKPQVGGEIAAQYVKDGADVTKGDLLFRIDPRAFELAIREAQAKLDRDKALLVKADGDLKRSMLLKAKDVVAQEQYDQAYSQAKTLEGTISLDQASLDRARLDLEYASVRAPISGRVGTVQLTAGNVLKANDDRTMCVINQINPIFISFSVPERYLPAIMARHKEGPLEVMASPDGEQSREPLKARLASVDNAVDSKTGSIRLKAVSENTDHRLWPGQFVRVSLVLSTLRDAVVIPTQAVMDGLKGPYVYVIGQGGVAEARQITPGPIIDAETVVEKGLAAGEQVVVDGQVRLAPGAKAEIKAAADATGTSPRTGAEEGK